MVELLTLQIAHFLNPITQVFHRDLDYGDFVIATDIYEKPENFNHKIKN